MKAYKEASRWNDATRIAREFLPHKVYKVTSYKVIKLQNCKLYVTSYKVESYKLQVTSRIARELLKVGELMAEHNAYLRGGSGHESDEALMAPGRALEEGREFSKAIDAYLSVTAERAKSHDFLEEVHLGPPSTSRVTALPHHHHEPTHFCPTSN